MADESAVAEPSTEQQLDALFAAKESKPAASAAAAGAPLGATSETPLAASPAASETDPLLAALEAIEEEKPEVKPDDKPALSPEQKAVLDVIPDAKVAVEMYNTVQNYKNFVGALEGGKFGDVEAMLTEFNPVVWDGLLEHIYEKNKEAFIDRFIAEAEGKGQTKEFKQLQKEVQTLKSSLEEKKTTNARTEAEAALTANFQKYNQFVDELYEKLKFNKADRRYVTNDLNARIAADPKLLATIKGGNPKAVIPLFKITAREYLNRDKQVVEETKDKIAVQDKKKLPLGGGAAEVLDEIPDDINKVPKGKLEEWSKRQIDKLFSKKK